jgi:hypothetical protein
VKPKSITKKPTTRKRPKSVLQKAWATRRAKAAASQFKGYSKKNLPQSELDRRAGIVNTSTEFMPATFEEETATASSSKATPISETETHRSDNAATANGVNAAFDAISRNNEMHRDELLLGFMGDMSAMRRITNSGHYPVMVSRAQAEAIESFLDEHGYSPWGRSTGNGGASEVRKAA